MSNNYNNNIFNPFDVNSERIGSNQVVTSSTGEESIVVNEGFTEAADNVKIVSATKSLDKIQIVGKDGIDVTLSSISDTTAKFTISAPTFALGMASLGSGLTVSVGSTDRLAYYSGASSIGASSDNLQYNATSGTLTYHTSSVSVINLSEKINITGATSSKGIDFSFASGDPCEIYADSGNLTLESQGSKINLGATNSISFLESESIFQYGITIQNPSTWNQTNSKNTGLEIAAPASSIPIVVGTSDFVIDVDNSSVSKVGIGTLTPATKLQVVGDVTATAYHGDGSNLTGVTTDPAGSNTQIQFNNSSAFGASSDFTWDNANKRLDIAGSFVITGSSTAQVFGVSSHTAPNDPHKNLFTVASGEIGFSSELDQTVHLKFNKDSLTSSRIGNIYWHPTDGGVPRFQFSNDVLIYGSSKLRLYSHSNSPEIYGANGALYLNTKGTTTSHPGFQVSGSDAQTLFSVRSPSDSNIFNVSGSGYIGVGAAPQSGYRLNVGGDIRVVNSRVLAEQFVWYSNSTQGYIKWDDGQLFNGLTRVSASTNARVEITGSDNSTLLGVHSTTNSNILSISGSARVGIGQAAATDSALTIKDVNEAANSYVLKTFDSSGNLRWFMRNGADSNYGTLGYNGGTGSSRWSIGSTTSDVTYFRYTPVAIGQNTAAAKLHVASSDEVVAKFHNTNSTNAAIQIQSGGNSDSSKIYFNDGETGYDNAGRGALIYTHGTAEEFKFNMGGDHRITLEKLGHIIPAGDNAQNLGSSTKRWSNLHVVNTTVLSGSVENLQVSGASDSILVSVMSPAVSNILKVTGSGNVGIRNSTPDAQWGSANSLVIGGPNHAGLTIRTNSSNSGNVVFSDGTSGGAEYAGVIQYTHGADAFRIYTGNQLTTPNVYISSTHLSASMGISSSQLTIDTVDNSMPIVASTATNSNIFVVTGSGRVSINPSQVSSNPTAALNVRALSNSNVLNLQRSDVGSISMQARITANASFNINNANFTIDHNYTEKFRFSATGNLGINTNNPGKKLTIKSSAATEDVLEIQSSNGSVTKRDEMYNHNGATRWYNGNSAQHIIGTDTTFGGIVFNEQGLTGVNFRVEALNQENMFFVDSANARIGIGTNSPQALLHLEGNASGTDPSYPHILLSDTTPADTREVKIECTAGDLVIKQGNALTTNSPTIDGKYTLGDGGLHILNGSNLSFKNMSGHEYLKVATTGTPGATIGYANTNTHTVKGSLQATGDYSSIKFNTTSGIFRVRASTLDDLFYVKEDGKVGINNSSPSYWLDVKDSGGQRRFYVSGDVWVASATDLKFENDNRQIQWPNGSGRINSHSSHFLYLQESSKCAVGIANSVDPAAKLHVSGSNTDVIFRASSNDSQHLFNVNGNGRIGIGVESPSENVDIEGNMRLNGMIKSTKFADLNNVGYYLQPSNSTVSAKLNGAVIIGGTTPAAQLDVQGDMLVKDAVATHVIEIQNTNNTTTASAIKTQTGEFTPSADSNIIVFKSGDNSVGLGGIYYKHGTGVTFGTTSDERLKNNVRESTSDSLEKITALGLYDFEWKSSGYEVECGFVAQNVEEHFPEVVFNNADDMKSIATENLIPHLTKAIQQQQEIIQNLLSRVEELESKN